MKRPKETTRHDPFEVVLCTVFGFSTLLQCCYGPPSGSAITTLPPGFRRVWLGLVLFGCAATLVGLFARRVWGYLIEQIGLEALGWSLAVYGVQLLLMQIQHRTLDPTTVLGVPLPIALGIAFLWKRRQVLQDVQALHSMHMKEAS